MPNGLLQFSILPVKNKQTPGDSQLRVVLFITATAISENASLATQGRSIREWATKFRRSTPNPGLTTIRGRSRVT